MVYNKAMQTIQHKPKRGAAIPTRFTTDELEGIDKTRLQLGRMSRSTFIRFATNLVGAQVETGIIKLHPMADIVALEVGK